MMPMAEWDRAAAEERKAGHAEERKAVKVELLEWRFSAAQVAAHARVHPTALSNWLHGRPRAQLPDATVRKILASAKAMGLEMARKRLAERDPEFAEWDRQRQEAARGDGSITIPSDVKDILP